MKQRTPLLIFAFLTALGAFAVLTLGGPNGEHPEPLRAPSSQAAATADAHALARNGEDGGFADRPAGLATATRGDSHDGTTSIQVPGTEPLSGRVFDAETGTGIAGVVVEHYAAHPHGTHPPRATNHWTVTAADGRFSFAVPMSAQGSDPRIVAVVLRDPWTLSVGTDLESGKRFDRGYYNMFFATEGAAPGLRVFAAARENNGEYSFPLVTGIAVEGRLADESGGTLRLGGTPILANYTAIYPNSGTHAPISIAESDGTFRFAALPNREVLLRVDTAEVFGEAPLSPRFGARTARIDLILKRKPSVVGSLADAEGAPVAGVQLMLRSIREDLGIPARYATTDAEGSFAFGKLHPAVYRIEQRGPAPTEKDLGIFPPSVHVELEAGQPDVELPLRYYGRKPIDGMVADRSGAPIAGATVTLHYRWLPSIVGVTDGAGYFTLPEHVAGAEIQFATARREGYETMMREPHHFVGESIHFVLEAAAIR